MATRSVVKHNYIKGSKGKARAKAHVNYVQFRRDREAERDRPREFYSSDREGINGREVKRLIESQDDRGVTIHKLILSPGVPGVDMNKYSRSVMDQFGREKGLDLQWFAVDHDNTRHDHAHIIIMGMDKNGRQVRFDGREDYQKLREFGDRYLERNHYYDRFLDRGIPDLLRGPEYKREGQGDFRSLFGQWQPADRQPEKEKPREPWDKEKAIEHLKEQEKIRVDGHAYTKFSPLDDLKALDERLKADRSGFIEKDKYRELKTWIGCKEHLGDDFYEKQAREKWEERSRSHREFLDLDEELRKSFTVQRENFGMRIGRPQRVREQQGRMSDSHFNYTGAMQKQRLKDLSDRNPEFAESLQREFEFLDRLAQEVKVERKPMDLDRIFGTGTKQKDRGDERAERGGAGDQQRPGAGAQQDGRTAGFGEAQSESPAGPGAGDKQEKGRGDEGPERGGGER